MTQIELRSEPAWWLITLLGGVEARVFADSYSDREADTVFYVQYVVRDGRLNEQFDVDEQSHDGSWVNIRVAQFPSAQVLSVRTLDSFSD